MSSETDKKMGERYKKVDKDVERMKAKSSKRKRSFGRPGGKHGGVPKKGGGYDSMESDPEKNKELGESTLDQLKEKLQRWVNILTMASTE